MYMFIIHVGSELKERFVLQKSKTSLLQNIQKHSLVEREGVELSIVHL